MNNIKGIKKNGLLLIGLLIVGFTYSQENFIPGYVIKNNTDTLFGFIDYRNWEYNPDKIGFKTKIENNRICFNPTEISEFMVEGEIYRSGIVKTEVTPTQTNNLKFDHQLYIKIDTTFLQTLFRGEKSLYYYKNRNGRENFYIKQDTGLDLLVYKKYLKMQENKRVITENRKYLGQLILYLNDCETIDLKVKNTLYNKKSLSRLFKDYYKCSSFDIIFQKEIEKTQIEFGAFSGVSLSTIEFKSDAFPYLVKGGYNPSINFSSGIFLNIVLPRNQGKWSINNEILHSSYNTKGSYKDFEDENNSSIIYTEIGYSYLKINNSICYKYPIGNLFLFFNGGISNGFSFSEKNYKKKESTFYNTHRVIEGLAIDDTRKYEQGYVLGTGIKYDRFSVEVRYERGSGMSDYVTLNSITKRYFLLVGYRF